MQEATLHFLSGATLSATNLNVTARDREVLEVCIGNFFGAKMLDLCTRFDASGFCIATLDGAGHFAPTQHWSDQAACSTVSLVAMSWLDSLSYREKQRICGRTPIAAAFADDPATTLGGFNVSSTPSADNEHFMLTVVPAWYSTRARALATA